MTEKKIGAKSQAFAGLSTQDKLRKVGDLLLNNAMYIIIILAVIYISIKVPAFLGLSSIVNVISLTAAKLPIALGIGGCIVLTGTDISAGRVVGLTACISASLLTTTFKVFPDMNSAPPDYFGNTAGDRNGWPGRPCQRFQCGEVQAASVYCNIVHAAHCLRYHSDVPDERLKQRTDTERPDGRLPFPDHGYSVQHSDCDR